MDVILKKPRKPIDVRKAVFTFVLKKDEFTIDELFSELEILQKEKVNVYPFLRELCYFNYIQAIKSRYFKV